MTLKVASWNINSLKIRLPHVLEWLEKASPDVLALQELKLADEFFPYDEIKKAGYYAYVSGQRTYNGVAILTRHPGENIIKDFPTLEDLQRRVVAITIGDVRIVNVYVPNGQQVGSDKYQYKLKWLQHLTLFLQDELKRHSRLILMGDFNIAPHSEDVHDPKEWEGQVLCSEPEREAYQAMLALGLRDTFRLFPQAERSFSWWDYRLLAFRRKRGLRIDLVLASDALSSLCIKSGIDVEPRTLERPSDHAPVWAEFRTASSL